VNHGPDSAPQPLVPRPAPNPADVSDPQRTLPPPIAMAAAPEVNVPGNAPPPPPAPPLPPPAEPHRNRRQPSVVSTETGAAKTHTTDVPTSVAAGSSLSHPEEPDTKRARHPEPVGSTLDDAVIGNETDPFSASWLVAGPPPYAPKPHTPPARGSGKSAAPIAIRSNRPHPHPSPSSSSPAASGIAGGPILIRDSTKRRAPSAGGTFRDEMTEDHWRQVLRVQASLLLQGLPQAISPALFGQLVATLRQRVRGVDLHHYTLSQWRATHRDHVDVRLFQEDLRTNPELLERVRALNPALEHRRLVDVLAASDVFGFADQNRKAVVSILESLRSELPHIKARRGILSIYVLAGRRPRLALQVLFSDDQQRWVGRDVLDQSHPTDFPLDAAGAAFDVTFKALRQAVQQRLAAHPVTSIAVSVAADPERELYSWNAFPCPPEETAEVLRATAAVAPLLGHLAQVLSDKPKGLKPDNAWTALFDELVLAAPAHSSLPVSLAAWQTRAAAALCPTEAKYASLAQLYRSYVGAPISIS